jgi:hypothetical protein
MEHLKTLTSQQLIIAACCAVMVAGTMLSHGNNLGFLPLAMAAACGLGAFAKSKGLWPILDRVVGGLETYHSFNRTRWRVPLIQARYASYA